MGREEKDQRDLGGWKEYNKIYLNLNVVLNNKNKNKKRNTTENKKMHCSQRNKEQRNADWLETFKRDSN